MKKDLASAERKGKLSRVDYIPESTVGSQSYRKSEPSRRAIRALSPAVPAVDKQALCKQIAEKAYELYQSRGRTHGHDLDDWLEAERMVLAELKGLSDKRELPDPRRPARRSKKG